MIDKLDTISREALGALEQSNSLQDLAGIQHHYLNKKTGIFPSLTGDFAKLNNTEKALAGRKLNDIKQKFLEQYHAKHLQLSSKDNKELFFDVTLPPTVAIKNNDLPLPGRIHPITQTISEITQIFEHLGFSRRRYREIESDYYAFEALNLPPEHPARAEWETFYLTDGSLITPHTSSGQIREMEKGQVPIRMINISRTGRRQEDVSHAPSFYQFEGLLVDREISITHLKGVLDYFVKNFFDAERRTRLRPYNFCFTEPSFEIDIDCSVCGGKGCRVCKEGWLELGGAGMVHPNVLRNMKIDPRVYNGFAFGWGVERVLMMRSKINDIRDLFHNDLRFLEQF